MSTIVSSPGVAGLGGKTTPRHSTLDRLISVDVLRGLAMVMMALDHTRDFLTFTRSTPEDLAHTTGALFFTRVVTHFCAPIFAFLAGTGAFLFKSRGHSTKQVSVFLLTRGLWLVFLELTVIDFAWGFVPWVHAGVLWGLGWSMVAMAVIVWLPIRWIAGVGLGMIAAHNLLDGVTPTSFGKIYWAWTLLHSPGPLAITSHFSFSVRYVLIPWVGVMAAGFAFGSVLLKADRRRRILSMGISSTALFFALRLLNHYGNGMSGLPAAYPYAGGPWRIQPGFGLTIISFFNTLKYPPSLDYLLMTLGPALILLGLLDGAKADGAMSRILLVFGRAPLLYYILHLYLIHVITIVVCLAFHQPIWHGSVVAEHAQRPIGYGHGLPFIYAVWMLVVTLLYFPCRWFVKFRSRHREWNWLRYL